MYKLIISSFCAIILILTSSVSANEWKPNTPVKFMLPSGKGGSFAIMMDAIQPEFDKCFGQTLEIVSNTKGTSGLAASQEIAAATPDGHRMLGITPSILGFNHVFIKDPGYKNDQFTAVATIGEVAKIVVANPKYKSFQDLVEAMKKEPNKLNYGTLHNSSDHLNMFLMRKQAGVDANNINYRISSDYVADLLSGRLDFVSDNYPVLAPHIKSGAVRVLAVSAPQRLPQHPDVPTWKELGFDEINISTWYGVVAPKATPPDRVKKLSEAFQCSLKNPSVKDKLQSLNVNVTALGPAESQQLIDKTAAVALKMGKLAGIEAK